jgi:PmbA protein
MPSNETSLVNTATSLVERLRKLGADTAEVSASSGWELSTRVRLGEIELIEEAGHRHVSVRVIRDGRVALTSTSDLTPEGLDRCVNDSMQQLELSEPDPDAGPADPTQLAVGPFEDFDLYDPAADGVDAAAATARAREAERVALAWDDRLKNSEGATFSRASGESALVLSSGFVGTKRGTQVSLVVTPVVEDEGGKRRRGYYYTLARHLEDLETAEFVGQEAARRTVAQLGARPVKTCETAIVFSPDAAKSIISAFVGCAMGSALWRKASYLCGREGSVVASERVTLVDDPFLRRGFGSRAWDGEGLPCRRNTLVERGTYVGPLLDCLSARKLNRSSTGSAARSGGSLSPTTSNLLMQPGEMSEDALLAATERGLYVTDMMGFGFNAITGDFSRGASGFWIEGGQKIHPVSEVTISSNLDKMLRGIDEVAIAPRPRGSMVVPAFRVASMTLAGS